MSRPSRTADLHSEHPVRDSSAAPFGPVDQSAHPTPARPGHSQTWQTHITRCLTWPTALPTPYRSSGRPGSNSGPREEAAQFNPGPPFPPECRHGPERPARPGAGRDLPKGEGTGKSTPFEDSQRQLLQRRCDTYPIHRRWCEWRAWHKRMPLSKATDYGKSQPPTHEPITCNEANEQMRRTESECRQRLKGGCR